MAKYADALIAFWDGESRGTKNIIDLAKKYKVNYRIKMFSSYGWREQNQPGFAILNYKFLWPLEDLPGVSGFLHPTRLSCQNIPHTCIS